jgi:hypothetical protein
MRADSAVPRIDDWFWEVLESAQHSVRTLCSQLEALPRDKLYSFQYQYWEAMDCLPPGVPADFDAEDFAEWVVSQGRAFYYDLRRQPARLQACLDMYLTSEGGRGFLELRWDEQVERDEYRGWQSPFQVGFAIYQLRFGKDIRRLIWGYDWDPDLPQPSA